MGKDMDTVKKIEKKIKDMTKNMSNPKSTKMNTEKALVKLLNMKSQLRAIRSSFRSSGVELSLIDTVLADIAALDEELKTLDIKQDLAFGISGSQDSSEVDDDEVFREFARFAETLVPEPDYKPKYMDVKDLCENIALPFLRCNKGASYEFVDFASYLIPTYSSVYGYGLHLNFFARQAGAPPELLFVEATPGDPVRVLRCVQLVGHPYPHGDKNIVFHPDNERCAYCEHAKDGSLEKNFCLPPPYPLSVM